MTITIQPKEAFRVKKVRNVITGQKAYMVYDGNEPLMVAEMKDYVEYKDNKRDNECFRFCETFKTEIGATYIYWRDEELNADYITIYSTRSKTIVCD